MEANICIISNIPSTFRSAHLRKYFVQYVENGLFACFHFRHRPETKVEVGFDSASSTNEKAITTHDTTTRDITPRDGKHHVVPHQSTCCCAVRVQHDHVTTFLTDFHMKPWDPDDPELGKAMVVRTKLSGSLRDLPELNPPKMMPNGNVGTPTRVFFTYINKCLLPPSIIKKLGLKFEKGVKRKQYTAVPPYYANAPVGPTPSSEPNLKFAKPIRSKDLYFTKAEQAEERNSDDGEDWDRHEALHDDVTSQDRTKERLYEEEMEIVWDKGSSGLVFYTDGNFWADQEGKDTDGLWADDWDVDMGMYEGHTGDKDAQDFISASTSRDFKSGIPEEETIGHFEKHTRGFGSRMMRKQGWSTGQGIGKSKIGPVLPVSHDEVQTQNPRDKSGLGFRGDPDHFQPLVKLVKAPEDDEEYLRIGSMYDAGAPSRSVFNRTEPPSIKRRQP